jgi:endogenous inhibitor of DNA gyrase (YacG/DUF329 family)
MLGTSRDIACSMNMKHLSPEQVLVKCPQCGAWPMSLAPQESAASFGRLTFKCPKCQAQAVYTVGVAGLLIPAPGGSR